MKISLQLNTYQMNNVGTKYPKTASNNRTEGNPSLSETSRINFYTLKIHYIRIDTDRKYEENW